MRALYTIDTTTAQVRYAGNGVTTAFSVTFQFFEASTLRVRTAVGDVVTLEVLNTGYTVSGGGGETGTVTFLTAPPSGTNVIIDLDIPMLQQTVDLGPNGPLPAEDVEQGFDRIVTMVKQLRQQLLAVPELDATFNPDTDQPPILPPPSAGKTLVGREDEAGWENGDAFVAGAELPTLVSLLANRDLLEYDEASGTWRNRTRATVLGRELTSRGDVMVRQSGGTSFRLALGAANRFLKSDGTDLVYGRVDLATSDVTGVLPRANGGFTPSQASAYLNANVNMVAAGTLYTGPSLTLGTGVWVVLGGIVIGSSGGGDNFDGVLWDGTNFFASHRFTTTSVTGGYVAAHNFMAIVTDPAAAVRYSVRCGSRTDNVIQYNASGFEKDSYLHAFRIG